MVDGQTLADRFFSVIFSLYQRLAGDLVLPSLCRRRIIDVIYAPGSWMTPAASHSSHNVLIVDLNFDHGINHDARVLQGVGLRNRPREAIKQESISAVRLRNPFTHEANNDVV
jgi:23S rRNA U2552 (ribose-2'-O)-methylase RlmE/FtsJ